MSYNDENYLNKISYKLDRFTKKSSTLYNCRCPICNDSQKDSKKARGYFFPMKDGSGLFYSCRNCGVSLPFGAFLKQAFPEYYTQYRLENISNGSGKLIQLTKKNQEKPKEVNKDFLNIKPRESLVMLKDLPENHLAVDYLKSRGIHDLSLYGYAEKFSQYVAEQTNNAEQYAKLPNDSRIIIPIKSPNGELWGFQGRALSKKQNVVRYITVRNSENFCKIFGLDRFDKTKAGFIVEGPFDSTFLPNCISMCGSSLDPKVLEYGYVIPENTIIIFDNESRNKEIVQSMIQKVNQGFRVYIPPVGLSTKLKDINEMVLAGWTQKQLVELFVRNSHTGMIAKAMITNWRKC